MERERLTACGEEGADCSTARGEGEADLTARGEGEADCSWRRRG